jgi:hypothetical protein
MFRRIRASALGLFFAFALCTSGACNRPSSVGTATQAAGLPPGYSALGYQFFNGIEGWAFKTSGYTVVINASTEAEAAGILGNLATPVASGGAAEWPIGVAYLVPDAAAAADATALEGTVAVGGTSVLGAAMLIVGTAAYAALAIDAINNNGEWLWTTVGKAGGWQVVLLGDPSAKAPTTIPTVNCNDPTPLDQQCRASSLRNIVTGWSPHPGETWSCGDFYDFPDATGGVGFEPAKNRCSVLASLCVAKTANVCAKNNIPRNDVHRACKVKFKEGDVTTQGSISYVQFEWLHIEEANPGGPPFPFSVQAVSTPDSDFGACSACELDINITGGSKYTSAPNPLRFDQRSNAFLGGISPQIGHCGTINLSLSGVRSTDASSVCVVGGTSSYPADGPPCPFSPAIHGNLSVGPGGSGPAHTVGQDIVIDSGSGDVGVSSLTIE